MNTTETQSTSLQPQACVVYTSESSLRQFRAFLSAAMRDLRASWPTTTRFFRRSLTQRYRYSSLGLVWAFMPTVITAFILIAGQKSRLIAHSNVPAPFFGVFGLALGQTFLEGLNALRSVFTSHQNLLRRNNVPIEGLIAAAIIDTAFSAAIRIVVIMAAFVFFSVVPAITAPLAIFGFIGTLLIGCGIGLLLAPYSSLKRDIENVMMFLPYVLFAVTPIFVAANSNSPLTAIYRFNPLAWIFDSTRTLAYGAPGHRSPALLSVLVGVILVLVGWLMCRLWRPYVVERSLV